MSLGPGLEREHKELASFVSSGRVVGVEVAGPAGACVCC